MAGRDDIRSKVQRVNPRAVRVCDEMDAALLKAGYRGAVVTTTDDMAPEEEELALMEGFLREGCSEGEAVRKAGEYLSAMKRVQGRVEGR